MGMELKCALLQSSSDKKRITWLLVRPAHCTSSEGSSPGPPASGRDSDDEEEKIAHPSLELWRHTLLRGANLGSFCTIVFGVPTLLFRGVRQPGALLRRLAGISPYGVVSSSFFLSFFCY